MDRLAFRLLYNPWDSNGNSAPATASKPPQINPRTVLGRAVLGRGAFCVKMVAKIVVFATRKRCNATKKAN